MQELAWAVGSTSWTSDFLFPNINGNGGLSCAGAGSGTSYLYLLNSRNQLELWWKDFNTAGTNSTNHPLGLWTKGMYSTTPSRPPYLPLGPSNSLFAILNRPYRRNVCPRQFTSQLRQLRLLSRPVRQHHRDPTKPKRGVIQLPGRVSGGWRCGCSAQYSNRIDYVLPDCGYTVGASCILSNQR